MLPVEPVLHYMEYFGIHAFILHLNINGEKDILKRRLFFGAGERSRTPTRYALTWS